MTEHKPVSDLSRPVAVLDRAALARAVALAELPVDRKNTIPILANLRLKGSGEALVVTGTDLDCEVTVTVPGAADARLDTTVPAKMLKDILAKAKDSELASLDDSSTDEAMRCGVDLGGVRFTLNALHASDFPNELGSGEYSHSFQLEASVLSEMLDRVRFSISTEETRYYLNGVYLHTIDRLNVLRFVATDGHRLALMSMDAPEGSAGMPGVILPRRTVFLVLDALKILRKGKATVPPVTVHAGASRFRFDIGAVSITTKLIDGHFPDYERVIPRGGDPMVATVKPFVDGIEQVSLILPDKARAVKLEIASNVLSLSVTNPDSSRAETSIPVTFSEKAGSFSIGFNSRYLLDILDEMTGDGATFMLIDSGSPTVVFDPADSRFTAVLMPMRT